MFRKTNLNGKRPTMTISRRAIHRTTNYKSKTPLPMAELSLDSHARTPLKDITHMLAAPARLSGFAPLDLIYRPTHTFTNPFAN